MKPNQRFRNKPKEFWANVRTISQQVGYTMRGEGQVKIPAISEIKKAYKSLGLNLLKIIDENNNVTEIGNELLEYFKYRARILNTFVEPRLMDPDRARREFKRLYKKISPKCPIPMNKQKGEKKAEAYLTAIVNMIIEANASGF